MKNIYLIFFILFLAAFMQKVAFAQQGQLDSLRELLKTDKEDTNKIFHLNAIGRELCYGNPDTAILLGEQALAIVLKLDSAKSGSAVLEAACKKCAANTYGQLGNYYSIKSDFPTALGYYLKALKFDEEIGDQKRIASQYGNIGIIYDEEGDFDKALDYYLKALNTFEKIGDNNKIATQLDNVGVIYDEQSRVPFITPQKKDELLKKSLDTYARAVQLMEEVGNKLDLAVTFGNIGTVYSERSHMPMLLPSEKKELSSEALLYFRKAIDLDAEFQDEDDIARNISNIGSINTGLGNYKLAFDYLFRALAISDSMGGLENMQNVYNEISTLYEESSIPLPDSIGGKMLNMEQMRLRALHYFKSYVDVRDTLFSEENKKQLVRKEMNYEFDKKEAQTKANNDKKEALAQEQLKQKETQRNYFIAGFALVLVLAGFIFRSYRQKQKANEIISQQKLLVEMKQKEILDSIHYAKRIQDSLLPSEKYISKNLFPRK
ncbi:MAG: tetratricopeptide repeat protein [Bacteroidetes bacterium]|nr:tetratricopeptide repeat protein [Bacteroidota bacterium]